VGQRQKKQMIQKGNWERLKGKGKARVQALGGPENCQTKKDQQSSRCDTMGGDIMGRKEGQKGERKRGAVREIVRSFLWLRCARAAPTPTTSTGEEEYEIFIVWNQH